MTTRKYRITRTGRRATPRLVELSDGSKRRLNPTGSHIWEISPEDVRAVLKVPGTRVVCVDPLGPHKSNATLKAEARAKAAAEAAAKAQPKKKAKKKGKGKG